MCMALAVNGCGSEKETTSTESESTATEQQAEDSAEEEEVQEPYTDSTGATRQVSVDNVEKYVTIADYKGITLDNSVPEVTDEDIENRIAENLKDNSVEVTDENAAKYTFLFISYSLQLLFYKIITFSIKKKAH